MLCRFQGCLLVCAPRYPVCLAAVVALTACATVIEGTTDKITVSTTPPGARCTITRDGAELGTISATPGSLTISKSINAILVTCDKAEHETTTKLHMSNVRKTTAGNYLLGGAAGLAIDASTGANYRYPPRIDIVLVPVEPLFAPLVDMPAAQTSTGDKSKAARQSTQ